LKHPFAFFGIEILEHADNGEWIDVELRPIFITGQEK